MNIFLANVGNRDIGINLGYEDNPLYYYFDKNVSYFNEENSNWKDLQMMLKLAERGTRHAALELDKEFEIWKNQIIAPILFPALKEALTEVEKIDYLLLFVTNNPSVDKNWHWDTIESGKVLQKLIQSTRNLSVKIKKIEIVEVPNAHLYDSAYDLINQRLAKDFQEEKIAKAFATISGGIPAANSALRSQTIERYGRKAVLIQTNEPSKDERKVGICGEARKLNNWNFRKTIIFRLIKVLLERYDYEGVLTLLRTEKVPDRKIITLCTHAKARFNFDFEGAVKELEDFGSENFPAVWKESAAMDFSVQRISELAFTGHILLKRHDFVGFLTRVASLREITLFLIAKTVNGKDVSSRVNTFERVKMIEKDLKKLKTGKELQKKTCVESLIKQIDNLNNLYTLRNDSLHKSKGVNLAHINTAFPNVETQFPQYTDTLIDSLKEMRKLYGKDSTVIESKDIYNKIGKAILKQLESI